MSAHQLRRTAAGLRRIAAGCRARVSEKRGERALCHEPAGQRELDQHISKAEQEIAQLEAEAAELERKATAFESHEARA
jgi:hypothetical protein